MTASTIYLGLFMALLWFMAGCVPWDVDAPASEEPDVDIQRTIAAALQTAAANRSEIAALSTAAPTSAPLPDSASTEATPAAPTPPSFAGPPRSQPTAPPSPSLQPTTTPVVRTRVARPSPSEPLVRGKSGDYWADVVLGQPDFSEIAPNAVVPFKVFNPGGVIVDRSVAPGRAYVWDAGNNRILGIDLARCYGGESPCRADLVIGQPSLYDHSACNGDSGMQNLPYRALATAATLCGTPDLAQSPWESHAFVNMALDTEGNLYVPDSFNNRILFYERPFETDGEADAVWGQADFSGIICNRSGYRAPTAQSLCFHSPSNYDRGPAMGGWPARGVNIDAEGNLWIADSGNNRVLRFPLDPATGRPGPTADLVLGQPDFNQNRYGTGPENLFAPAAVRFDSQGKLYVADAYNHRVLVFEPPFQSGMPALTTYGSGFRNPIALEMDLDNRGVWVNYYLEDMVVLWNWDGTEVIRSVESGIHRPGGFGVDALGNLLVVQPHGHQDVVRIPPSGHRPDKRLFFPPGGFNFTSGRELLSARGVAAFGDQLVVSDLGRLMYWNGLEELTNGQPADGLIGPKDWSPGGITCCGKINADESGRLWVLSTEGRHGFVDIYQLPLTRRSTPLHTIWTRDTAFPVLGTDAEFRFGSRMFGVASVDGGRSVWLSDTDNHRVVRVRNPLTAPVVDVILGQTTPEGVECNRGQVPESRPELGPTADMLCRPGDLTVDKAGNIWVSDHALEVEGNFRLLMFPAELFPKRTDLAIFAPSAAKIFSTHGDHDDRLIAEYKPDETSHLVESQHRGPFLAATFDTAFDSWNRMAVGFNMYLGGQFVGLYGDPLGPVTEPTDYLNDLSSMAFALDFDDNDNLYVADINRARVLVYRKPLGGLTMENDKSGTLAPPAPLPDYPATIREVSPPPSACVLRSAVGLPQGSLVLTVDGLPESGRLNLQIRKIASADTNSLAIDGSHARIQNGRVVVEGIWPHLWLEHPSVSAVVQVMQDGQPVTGWSPKFGIADDAATCADAPFTLPPTPTPTRIRTPTVIPIAASSAMPTVLPPTEAPVLAATVPSSPQATRPPTETSVPLPQNTTWSSRFRVYLSGLPVWLITSIGVGAVLVMTSVWILLRWGMGRGRDQR